MQSFGLRPSKTGQVDWNAARNSDTIKKVSPSSIPMNHGWMWLRQHGAKRSMRKYLALNCRRRPSLDPLESRYLLSGGIEVIEVHPAPALIIGIDLRQTPLPVNGFGSLAISSVSSGPGDWPMPGFHHDFSPLGELATPAPEFHTYSDPQVVSPWISPISESENAAVSTPNSESVAAAPAPPSHGDVPPGLVPPPGQPPPFLRVPHCDSPDCDGNSNCDATIATIRPLSNSCHLRPHPGI